MLNFPEAREYTVSELAYSLKAVLEKNFNNIKVRGEISSLKIADSGHIYFALKDKGALLNAICWRAVAAKMQVAVEEGMEVICRGAISSYPNRSIYQISVESIEIAGVGALLKLLAQRREKLTAEGLFAAERKKSIPFLPKVIAVVTSPTGAVIRDILHRIKERFPSKVLLWPVLVQGNEAAAQIAEAIIGLQNMPGHLPQPELIIVARGGGSVEDLWPFSEEIVVRAAAACKIPLISAVGHETDVTLIDFAADKRAPTPSAAAEMAVPVRSDLAHTLRHYKNRMLSALRNIYNTRASNLSQLTWRLCYIEKIVDSRQTILAQYWQRINFSITQLLAKGQASIERGKNALSPQQLRYRCWLAQEQLIDVSKRLEQAAQSYINIKIKDLQHAATLMQSYSHEDVLRRGFALVKAENELLTSAQSVQKQHLISIMMHDGEVDATIKKPAP